MEIKFNQNCQFKTVIVNSDRMPRQFENLSEKGLFNGDAGTTYYYLEKNLLLLGLGEKEGDLDEKRLAGYKLAKAYQTYHINESELDLTYIDDSDDVLPIIIEGLYYGIYHFDYFKTEKETIAFSICLNPQNEKTINTINEVTCYMEGNKVARNFVNYTANILYPESYVKMLQDEFTNLPVSIEIYNKEQMAEIGMHAALAVAKGSNNDPYFVVIKYQPNKKDESFLTLVGKGLTYDSGGYAIKPATGMVTMHTDMGGSAAVFGALKAIAQAKVKQNVCAVSVLAENLIDGKAYKNGDIISSMKGTSIFIGNTDAEGRVTMADSLYYAATKINSKAIVELSTLTGACIVALGDDIAGCVATNDKLFDSITKASLKAGELIHRFPVSQKLKDSVKHQFADMTNIPHRGKAGSITAGLFLTNFVEDKPYAHVDIAGPAYLDNAYRHYCVGATGFGVKTLFFLAKNFKI